MLTLDAAGNTLTSGTSTYSNAGQLTQAKNGTTVTGSYIYSALHQRTRKTVGTVTTVYHYDSNGHLIAETQPTGQLLRAYVYADDAPVAQIEPVTVLPADILIDNTQATVTGTWPTSTSLTGYYGSNYRTHSKGTGSNKVVWTPNVPSPGTYQVCARWVAASTNASNAPFTVKYSGGSATVTKSQRTSNGQWVLLGSYAFTSGTTGNITLTDKADGTVIADAIKLVATSGGTPQEVLRSIHTDHLNTPRLATNAQGTIIWRWEGKAFGDTAPNEDPDLDTIKTTINLRYPGQYVDTETGLFYNWNRYYSSVLGRYISSDPIGLESDLNTYAYVGNRPLRFVDPLGLAAQLCSKFPPLHTPHTFLCVDGNCSGKYPSGNPFNSPGEIRDDSPNQSSASCANVPNGQCDEESFSQCVTMRVGKRGSSGDSYNWLTTNCGQWAEDVITQCRNECKKKQK